MHAWMRLLAMTLSSLGVATALAAEFPRSPIRTASVATHQPNLPTRASSVKPAIARIYAPVPPHHTADRVKVARHRSSIQLASAEVEDAPPRPATMEPPVAANIAGQLAAELTTYPIDLGTALQLADAQNPQVAFVRERVTQAWAQQAAAEALWIPTLRGGVSYAEHDGTLQETPGGVIDAHRYSVQTGAGAAAFGAGPPMLPGLAADFHLADALFQPLAARRATEARRAASAAATNDLLLDVARAYLDLLRSSVDVTIADELQRNTRHLGGLTDAYARTGTGLQADADRLRTEVTLRHNEFVRAEESVWVASSRLVRLLHLDQSTILQPIGSDLVPLELVSPVTRLADSLAIARMWRPELIENQNLLNEAHARAQREKYAPLVPTLSLGMSYSGFGGGGSGSGSHFSDRTDFQALAYWQLRNLGLGDQAARRERLSQVRQAWHRQDTIADQVAQEVSEAYAVWRSRARQIQTAEQGVQAAKASYDRNLERIKGGQGLPIEVLQSIQALAAARREYARAVTEFNVAQFTLQRAIGQCLTDVPASPAVTVPAPSEPAR